MSRHFFQSASLRSALLAGYRTYAQACFWRKGARVFVNSVPKAGTHLLTTILAHVPGLMHSRLHLSPWDVNKTGRLPSLTQFEVDDETLRHKLSGVRGAQVASGHLPWRPQILKVLLEERFRVVHISRDEQAILTSRFHYILGLKRHPLHRQLTRDYPTDAERRRALCDGIPYLSDQEPGTDPFRVYMDQFSGWTETQDRPGYLKLTFEQLIGDQGGGSDSARLESLTRLLTLIFDDSPTISATELHRRTVNKKSVTFRRGRVEG